MADQMRLFPAEEEPASRPGASRGELHPVDELFALHPEMAEGEGFMQMLESVSRFPQYSPFNGFLLYLQQPDARQVATAAAWRRQYARTPKKGARPLLILAPMSPVHFVFEVGDTEGDPLPGGFGATGPAPPKILRKSYDRTVHNAGLHGIVVRHAPAEARGGDPVMPLTYDVRKRHESMRLEPGSSYLVFVDPEKPLEQRYASLVYGLGHIFCGHMGIDARAWWEDRRGIDRRCAEVEAESTGFLVCRRRGEAAAAEGFLQGLRVRTSAVSQVRFHAVLHAVHYIEEMGRKRWTAPQRAGRYAGR